MFWNKKRQTGLDTTIEVSEAQNEDNSIEMHGRVLDREYNALVKMRGELIEAGVQNTELYDALIEYFEKTKVQLDNEQQRIEDACKAGGEITYSQVLNSTIESVRIMDITADAIGRSLAIREKGREYLNKLQLNN